MSSSILVVEDDEDALTSWLAVLGSAGYSAVGASSFEEGRRLLEVYRPNLLITDVRLGAFNGLHLAIRAQREVERLPTIVVTGFADELIRSEAERLHAIYMEKPVTPDALLAAVKNALTTSSRS
jgi:DNA-binding NtrC family response regulator